MFLGLASQEASRNGPGRLCRKEAFVVQEGVHGKDPTCNQNPESPASRQQNSPAIEEGLQRGHSQKGCGNAGLIGSLWMRAVVCSVESMRVNVFMLNIQSTVFSYVRIKLIMQKQSLWMPAVDYVVRIFCAQASGDDAYASNAGARG